MSEEQAYHVFTVFLWIVFTRKMVTNFREDEVKASVKSCEFFKIVYSSSIALSKVNPVSKWPLFHIHV